MEFKHKQKQKRIEDIPIRVCGRLECTRLLSGEYVGSIPTGPTNLFGLGSNPSGGT